MFELSKINNTNFMHKIYATVVSTGLYPYEAK